MTRQDGPPASAPRLAEVPAPHEAARPAPRVSIVIPTFRRPASLERALDSCARQSPLPSAELVVVDNCPRGSAREAVERFARRASLPVRYACEVEPGVAAARNRGVSMARGEWVAFLDDDEEALPDWLDQLLRAQARCGADVIFGAVRAELEGGDGWGGEAARTFGRIYPQPTGRLRPEHHATVGTGNSLFRRALLGSAPFQPELGCVGGEDSALIKRLLGAGVPLGWCREAVVKEHVGGRATLRGLLERRFSAGQVRTATCWTTRPRQPLRAVTWMVIGAAQAVIGAVLAGCLAAFRSELARRWLLEAAAGAGKVLWMPPFRVQRYPTRQERQP